MSPPVYPTRVEITPAAFLKWYSLPQKHPEAKMARSVVGDMLSVWLNESG